MIVLDAPSNLGLRPPEEGSVPGCYKLPWALRDRGLLKILGAEDGGSLVPPRYRAPWNPGDGVRNAEEIASFSVQLADRVEALIGNRGPVLILGGDCSILIGNTLALKRRGRYGLVFLDAHSDFRHPGNAPAVGAAAGEDLAIVSGRGDARLINLEELGPYVRDEDIHVVGVRPYDEHLEELASQGIRIVTSQKLMEMGATQVSQEVLSTVAQHTQGFWIHLDVDVFDAAEMPATDSPEDDGPSTSIVSTLLRQLVTSRAFVGMEVTIYDPDLDPSGVCADRLIDFLVQTFSSTLGDSAFADERRLL
jgi:arginase